MITGPSQVPVSPAGPTCVSSGFTRTTSCYRRWRHRPAGARLRL